MTVRPFACIVLVAALLAGCGGGTPQQPAASGYGSNTGNSASGPAWLLTEAPVGAVAVAAAKQTAKEGDQIVIRGRIGGRADPMTKDVAVFVMMDSSIPTCLDRGDGCRKPWDYCCEKPAAIVANSATVQLVADSTSPLAVDLASHGFEPMDEVVVVGTVAARPTGEVLIIKAAQLHRVAG